MSLHFLHNDLLGLFSLQAWLIKPYYILGGAPYGGHSSNYSLVNHVEDQVNSDVPKVPVPCFDIGSRHFCLGHKKG